MSNPKRQHIVPRVYLENFVESDNRLTVFSKRRRKILRPKPKDTLIRKYYFSQPVQGKPNSDHSIETGIFNHVETKYPELYRAFQKEGASPDLGAMYQTILMLRCRSPAFREAYELALADILDDVRKSIPLPETPSELSHIPDLWDRVKSSIDPHRSITGMVHYMNNYTSAVTACSYSIKLAPKGTTFLTSDNPVIWFDKSEPWPCGEIYPRDVTINTRVFLPLNRTTVLWGRPARTGEAWFRNSRMELSRKLVLKANEMQLACAWDEVVGEIELPSQAFRKLSKLCPRMRITHFSPNRDEFLLERTELHPLREKYRFTYQSHDR